MDHWVPAWPANEGACKVVRRSGRTGVAVLAAGTLALGAAACGGGGEEVVAPDPASVPRDAAALVGNVPVSEREVEKMMGPARRNAGTINGKPIEETPEQVRQRALRKALQSTWLLREAKERGVVVKDVDVRVRWADSKKSLGSKRAVKRFLGDNTEQDVLLMLRDQMLVSAIEDEIRAEEGGRAEEELEKFHAGLSEGWRQETACRGEYVSSACGNAPDPEAASE